MPTKLLVASIQQPITRKQAKAQLRVTDEETVEDQFIDDLIVGATRIVEILSRRQFTTATYIKALNGFFDDRSTKHPSDIHFNHHNHHNGIGHEIIVLEHPPLQSVESIIYVDTDGITQSLDLADIQVDTFLEPGRIAPAFDKTWPGTRNQFNSVQITYKAGYGDDESKIPAEVQRAIKVLISHYFDNRDLVLTTNDVEQIEFPIGLMTIINQFALPEFR